MYEIACFFNNLDDMLKSSFCILLEAFYSIMHSWHAQLAQACTLHAWAESIQLFNILVS